REPTVTRPPTHSPSFETRGLLRFRRSRSSAKPTIRHTTPTQNTASATLSAGPRAKLKRSMNSAPLRCVVGRLLAVTLTQAAQPGGCRSEDDAHRRGASGKLPDLTRCNLARLAPFGSGQ